MFLIGYRGTGKTTVGRAARRAARVGVRRRRRPHRGRRRHVHRRHLRRRGRGRVPRPRGGRARRTGRRARATSSPPAAASILRAGEPRAAARRRVRRLADRVAGSASGSASQADPTTAARRPNLTAARRARGGAGTARRPRAALPRGRRFRGRHRPPSPEDVADAILTAWNGGSTCPTVVWCLSRVFVLGLMVGSFLNVLIARLPYEKSIVWPSVAVLPLLPADPLPRQPADHRLPAAARPVPRTAGRRSPAATCGSRSAPGWRSWRCSSLEVVVNWHEHPGRAVRPLVGWTRRCRRGRLGDVRVPRLPVEPADRGRGDRRRAPHHPAADPVHRGGGRHRRRGADAVAVAAPAGRRRTRSRPGMPWMLPEHSGKIPIGVQPWPFWGPPPAFAPPGSWQLGLLNGVIGALAGSLVVRVGEVAVRDRVRAARRSAWATPTC